MPVKRLLCDEPLQLVRRGRIDFSHVPDGADSNQMTSQSLVLYADPETQAGANGANCRYRRPRLVRQSRLLKTLRRDSIRIRVAKVGLCGTDLHLLDSTAEGYVRCSSPMSIPPVGRIIGHEATGIVTAVGDCNLPFSCGDVVCCESIVVCHHCRKCRQGQFNQCEQSSLIGLEQDGLFTEFADLPASVAHCVTDLAGSDRELEALACVEPAAVSYLACVNAQISPGDAVAVLGAGPIGFYTALMAKTLFGAASVCICEQSPFRREFARQAGDIVMSPEELFSSSRRFDALIDAAGALVETNRLIPRMNGNGRIVLLARTGQPLSIDHVDHVISKSLRIIGSRGHLGGAFDAVLNLVRANRLDLRLPVTRVVHGFDELAQALRNSSGIVDGDCKVVANLL